jgi:RNA-splicing ligase RtcB
MSALIEKLLKYPTLYCKTAADCIRQLEARVEKAEAELNSAREVNRVLQGQWELECKAADKARAERDALIEETRNLRDEAYEQGKHDGEAATIERCIEAIASLTDADIHTETLCIINPKEPT